ncbi:MAG: AbgT family transporter [Hormoscilla sp. GM7CHS1pb]|nr:AbgT family transporter [Hormoscilla sp. GM7CHS1pb]
MKNKESEKSSQNKKSGLLEVALVSIETVGNKLPDPVTLFFYLSIAVLVISAIAGGAKIAVIHTQETIPAISLLTGIRSPGPVSKLSARPSQFSIYFQFFSACSRT